MPDYTSRHRSNMTDPTRLSKSKLERGMVANIRYKKETIVKEICLFLFYNLILKLTSIV